MVAELGRDLSREAEDEGQIVGDEDNHCVHARRKKPAFSQPAAYAHTQPTNPLTVIDYFAPCEQPPGNMNNNSTWTGRKRGNVHGLF